MTFAVQVPPAGSLAVNVTWYTRPSPAPARWARSEAAPVPTPKPSGAEPTGPSCRIEVTVTLTAPPSGSVTPPSVTGTRLESGGQIWLGVTTAPEQSGGRSRR